MWIVVFGRHFRYVDESEKRYETKSMLMAFLVYALWYCWFVFSIYPKKYIKLYKKEGNVLKLMDNAKSDS